MNFSIHTERHVQIVGDVLPTRIRALLSVFDLVGFWGPHSKPSRENTVYIASATKTLSRQHAIHQTLGMASRPNFQQRRHTRQATAFGGLMAWSFTLGWCVTAA